MAVKPRRYPVVRDPTKGSYKNKGTSALEEECTEGKTKDKGRMAGRSTSGSTETKSVRKCHEETLGHPPNNPQTVSDSQTVISNKFLSHLSHAIA